MRTHPENDLVSPELRAVAEGFASLVEAGKYLSLSRATLYKLMDAGELAYARFGRSRRVPWASLKAYAAKSMVASVFSS
jgi:excisionase family DNA binding protein